MRRWVSVFAITSLFGVAPSHAAPDGKAEFLRWANEVARAKKLSVCRTGQLRYQGEAPGYFAALGDLKVDSESTPVVLFSNGTKQWAYEETGLTVHAGGCESPPVPWDQLDSLTIHAQDMATKYLWDEEDVTFVEGEPVMLREVHSNIDGDLTTDWLAATDQRTKSDPSSPEGPEEGDNGMLILLPPASRWLKSWKAPTFVPFGEKSRQGPADADLAVQALDLGKAGIRIVADVTDDRAVPTPARADAKALIRSDHLELWWVPVGAQDAKQLGIGMRADGSADVRWLMPSRSTEKLPAVRRTGSHFEIDLSPGTLGLDVDALDKHPTLPFTVAFSDTDDPGAKQQTVIATSPVRWNRKETFGELTRLPSNAKRFPTFGKAMPPERSK